MRLVRAVVDTSVSISAAINPRGFPARVIDAFAAGRFHLVTSEPMLEELAKILARPRIVQRLERAGFTLADREAFVALFREKAEVVPVTGEVKLCRDPNDDGIIETALRGAVDVLVSRDEDLTRDREIVAPLQRAGIRLLTVQRFLELLQGDRDTDAVIEAVGAVWGLTPGNIVDVEWTSDKGFRLTETAPDSTVVKRLIGHLSPYGIVSKLEPDLNFEQARVYHSIFSELEKRLEVGEQRQERHILLMRDEEYPALFHPLSYREANIPGNVKDGMMEVWQSIDDWLELRGYRSIKFRQGDGPWEIRAERRASG